MSNLGTNVQDKRDIRLGTGKLFLAGRNVGQLKGDVVLTPKQEFKDFEAGVPKQLIKSVKISEGATLKAGMAELNADNMALALGSNSDCVTKTYGDVSTPEEVTFTGTTPVSLSHTRGIKGVVMKTKEATPKDCVLGTDFNILPDGRLVRIADSTVITDGATVTVESYKYLEKAKVTFGGGAALPEMPMQFVYESPDGDEKITVEFYLGQIKGGQAITMKEDDFWLNDIEISALSDSSRPAGDQLGNVEWDWTNA